MTTGRDAALASSPSRSALRSLMASGRPLVMGIVNVTPDSFSDGGEFLAPDKALAQARRLVAEGADILDIGGESTRPYGSVPITAEEEWERIAPLFGPAAALGVPVSVDTMKASIAHKALSAGATIANDVWGLQRDSDMARVVAEHGADIIVMHNRTQADAGVDIFADIEAFFARSLEIAGKAGIDRDRIVLDPGIGFGKTPEQSIAVIANLDRFAHFGQPLLIGLSRKRFIASVSPSEPQQRLGGSIAGNLMAVRRGAAILRVHDVAETVQALRIAAAIEESR